MASLGNRQQRQHGMLVQHHKASRDKSSKRGNLELCSLSKTPTRKEAKGFGRLGCGKFMFGNRTLKSLRWVWFGMSPRNSLKIGLTPNMFDIFWRCYAWSLTILLFPIHGSAVPTQLIPCYMQRTSALFLFLRATQLSSPGDIKV